MPRFAIRNPYFILVLCLVVSVIGIAGLARMPVDMFPAMNIPVVVVATFYNGMAPEQIEADITSRFERFFTLGSGIEHIESRSLPLGLGLSLVLLYLVLVAQFRSLIDPVLVLLAVPPGIAGVVVTLAAAETTINIMSLMGVIMLSGIAVSNSILIIEFARHLREAGMDVKTAIARACRVRLRPVLMTSLATIIGLLPMALKMGTGSEAYAPLAQALIGGLAVSVVLTVFLVPAGYLLIHRREDCAA